MDPLFKALISLAVILMFAAALIAAQANANLHARDAALDGMPAETARHPAFDAESLSKLETLPHIVDTVLELPIVVDLGGDDQPATARHDTGFDDSQAQ